MGYGFLVFLCSALILAALGGLFYVLRKKFRWNTKVSLLLYIFILIWSARFAVCFAGNVEGSAGLSAGEKLMDSLVHTLQTFSMDESYTAFTLEGKRLLADVYGYSFLAEVYGVVISALDIFAPIMGGAILLEILTSAFPRLYLAVRPFRRKFVFSEMNEAAVTLAEDICRGDHFQTILRQGALEFRPLIVFTDAYPDQESEAKSELFGRARAMKAVSIKTDLTHLRFVRSKSVYYFLMDEDEDKSITALAGLLDGTAEGEIMWPEGTEEDGGEPRTKVFAFCRSRMSATMIRNLVESSPRGAKMMVRPIRDYANTAISLMYEVPLFTALAGRTEAEANAAQTDEKAEAAQTKEKTTAERPGKTIIVDGFATEKDAEGRIGGLVPVRELHVAILGSGSIAEEVMKAVYWCGQMGGIQLYIHVLSQEAPALMERLKRVCPEMIAVCEADSDLLKIYPKSDSSLKNPPYAILSGLDTSVDVEDLTSYPAGLLEKTDYFVVALGSDEKNIYVATELRRELTRRALLSGADRHPVIAPAIFEDRLAESITIKVPGAYEPYLVPFATLEKRFSCQNVFMVDVTAEALAGADLYDAKHHEKQKKDEYYDWANTARAVHAPYKLFAMGAVTGVDLTAPASKRFLGTKTDIRPDDAAFSWMEHRRWNAFQRTQGFRAPTKDQHDRYYKETLSHKHVELKLHPCLAESSLRGKDMPKEIPFDESVYDALDLVSVYDYHLMCETKQKEETAEGRQGGEYKQWDDYENDEAARALMDRLA